MKRLSLCNKILTLVFAVATIVMAILLKEAFVLIYLLLLLVPFVFRVKPVLHFLYLVFTFISVFLGGLCHLYQLTTWFDSFSHFSWGILSSLLGIYILDKFKMYRKENIVFNIVFVFLFSLATSGFWEVCEFVVDRAFDMDMQRNITTGVFDTMKDIIVALLGNILFLAWYYYETRQSFKGCIHYLIDHMDTK